MPYKARWNTATPGCVLFLLDQSNSMNGAFGGDQTDAGETKAEALARVCNDTILALINESREGTDYKDRLEIAIIGYGIGWDGKGVGSLLAGSEVFIPINTLRLNPIRTEQRQKTFYNPISKRKETITEEVPIWIEINASGWTPMNKAIKTIDPMIEKWCMQHPKSYPPIIIHVTDGDSSDDKSPVPHAHNLMRHSTADGGTIFCNCHLSSTKAPTMKFPHSKTSPAFPPENLAEILFDMSNPLTDNMRAFAEAKNIKHPCPEGSRCYIFNGSPDDLAQLIEVGSSGPRGLAY